ncbi:MAG: Asp23/Gls24 family envelope stress response protein [Clostridiales bacterium]|nr:MAG: Asp23/Gls24 family envelope stress response protein [Clostridiales bacterium]
MAINIYNDYGNIIITKEALIQIIGHSAIECYGLVGMASKSEINGFVRLLKREHLAKGVKVREGEEGIIIDLYVIVEFETKISVVAENIISTVKYNVEKQTGLKVEKVNINIEDVRIQS